MIALLNWRIWATVILAAVLGFTHLSAYRHGRQSVQAKWDAANVTQQAAAEKQAQANRDLQRQAELHYTVQREAQDRFIVTTVKEIHEAAAPLATCPVPARVVRVLNDAAACARGDTPSACGSDGQVPSP